ncbi:5922_t:CDS:1, partial [Ambispora leptoticha]
NTDLGWGGKADKSQKNEPWGSQAADKLQTETNSSWGVKADKSRSDTWGSQTADKSQPETNTSWGVKADKSQADPWGSQTTNKSQTEMNPPWSAQSSDKFVEEPRGRSNEPREIPNWSKSNSGWVQNSENNTNLNQPNSTLKPDLKSDAWW